LVLIAESLGPPNLVCTTSVQGANQYIHTEQNVSISWKKFEIFSIRINPSRRHVFPPLFLFIKSYAYLEVSVPNKTEMVDTESPVETPAEKPEVNMDRISSDDNTADGTKSESPIFEEPGAAPATVLTPWVAPNGGVKAWSAVLGGFLCQFASFGFLNV
jgi:hypothetical protein